MTTPTTENQNAPGTLPEQITIGETTYVLSEQPELKKLIAAAQKMEKTKLYATIENLNKSIADKEKELSALKTQALNGPAAQMPTPQQQSTPAQTPQKTLTYEQVKNHLKELNEQGQPLTVEHIHTAMAKMFEETLPSMLKESMKPLIEKTQKLEAENLSDYRTRRLQELGDAVIPEMVNGNSKEAIEQSIVNAIAVRSRYNVAASQQAPPPAANPAAATTPPPAEPRTVFVPEVPRHSTPEQQVVNIKKMSQDEFAKNRESLMGTLKNAGGEYPAMSL